MARGTKMVSGLRRVVLYLIDDVTIPTYLIVFVIVVMVAGFLYHCLTPFGHGMGRDSSPLSATSFSNGLYLSVVTVSSLGYSDMHPMGVSRAIACFEVLMGMTLSGLIIAKLASRRISFHVSRIYGSYTGETLDKMSKNFEDIAGRIERWGSEYSTKYEGIVGENKVKIKAEMIRGIEGIAGAMESHIGSLHEYVIHEVNQSDYFQNAPQIPITRLGNSTSTMYFMIVQVLIGLSPQSKIEILRANVQRKIINANQAMLQVSRVVNEHRGVSARPEVQRAFERVARMCSSISISLGELPEQEAPDQIVRETNDPRPYKETDDESAMMR